MYECVWHCVVVAVILGCYVCVSGVISSNKSMVLRIISQIRIGSDLTRFVMPIFIFEKRSLLELYAEFFAHPDIITKQV